MTPGITSPIALRISAWCTYQFCIALSLQFLLTIFSQVDDCGYSKASSAPVLILEQLEERWDGISKRGAKLVFMSLKVGS